MHLLGSALNVATLRVELLLSLSLLRSRRLVVHPSTCPLIKEPCPVEGAGRIVGHIQAQCGRRRFNPGWWLRGPVAALVVREGLRTEQRVRGSIGVPR